MSLVCAIVPAFVSTILLTLWAILTIPGHAKYQPRSQTHVPATGILRGLLYGMGALVVGIPYEILFNRYVSSSCAVQCRKTGTK
jgi:hypothetical protein